MYLVSQRLLNMMPTKAMVTVFDSVVVPLTQYLEKLFIQKKWVPFGKNIFLVAQKK